MAPKFLPWSLCSLAILSVVAPACGPGTFASSGSSFGDSGTGVDSETSDSTPSSTDGPSTGPSTATSNTSTADDGNDDDDPSDTDDSDTNTDTAPSTTDTDTDTSDDGSDSWTDPDDGGDDGPPPSGGTPQCELSWVFVDIVDTHGHIGNTPLAAPPTGGLLSINPIIGQGGDTVNVDAWFRRWSGQGDLQWEILIDWAANRDDVQGIDFDELGGIYIGGRLNANQGTEDAMLAGLSSEGEPNWIVLRGDNGGYPEVLYNGAVVVAAGTIGGFGAQQLELLALDPDNGEEQWSSAPELNLGNISVAGMVMLDGFIYVSINAGADTSRILRFDPPNTEPELLTEFPNTSTVLGLSRAGANGLAAVYRSQSSSVLALIDRPSGEIEFELDFADAGLGSDISVTAVVETATGLAVAGDALDESGDGMTFVIQLDEDLSPTCIGRIAKAQLAGINHPLELRDVSLGSEGELYTGSYVPVQRHSIIARWD